MNYILINTKIKYEKRDKSNYYGIKCQLLAMMVKG